MDPTAEQIAALVANARATWHAPGLAAVVVKDGRVLYLGGTGVRAVGDPAAVTADTLFPMASCTKAVTSTLLAVLADAETIGWDDPVRNHLPHFHLTDPAADKLVTVRDLLCHRTGLGGHDLMWYRAPWDLDEVVRRTTRLPLEYPFRSGFLYSSLPVIAAGKAIESRTRRGYGELVREKLGKPLGWTTGAVTSKEAAVFADRASGHRRTADGRIEPMPAFELREANAAGSLFLSARDLGAFLQLHLNEGTFAGKRIVSAANLAETRVAHTPVRRTADVAPTYPDTVQICHALGWIVYDHRGHAVAAHGGIVDGFRTQITLLPNAGVGIGLFNNLHGTKLNIALTNVLIDRLLDLPAKDWHAYFQKVETDEAEAKKAYREKRLLARDARKPPALPLASYAGEYDHPAFGTVTVTEKGGALTAAFSSFTLPLEHWEANTFRTLGDSVLADELLEFAVTGKTATGLTLRYMEFARKK